MSVSNIQTGSQKVILLLMYLFIEIALSCYSCRIHMNIVSKLCSSMMPDSHLYESSVLIFNTLIIREAAG